MLSPGFSRRSEVILHAGKPIAPNLDYDLPFIPVVMVIAPSRIGMGKLPGGEPPRPRDRRGPAVHTGQARPAAAGDHCSRKGTDRYDGSSAGEEKVSCAPDGLCSM